jgi:hypothetical protein
MKNCLRYAKRAGVRGCDTERYAASAKERAIAYLSTPVSPRCNSKVRSDGNARKAPGILAECLEVPSTNPELLRLTQDIGHYFPPNTLPEPQRRWLRCRCKGAASPRAPKPQGAPESAPPRRKCRGFASSLKRGRRRKAWWTI